MSFEDSTQFPKDFSICHRFSTVFPFTACRYRSHSGNRQTKPADETVEDSHSAESSPSLSTRAMTNNFTYISQPHSAPRLHSQTMPNRVVPLSLMADPRVIRGNTHSLARKISKNKSEDAEKEYDSQKPLSHTNQNLSFSSAPFPYYKFDPKPFAEKDIDMTQYLIEDENVVVEKLDNQTQADDFKAIPEPPPYIPVKSGVDKSTQVENTSDLFNFDIEVKPMLEVIVRKTLEQALMEVSAEFEIYNLENQIEIFEKEKFAERQWVLKQEAILKAENEKKLKVQSDMKQMKIREKGMKNKLAGVQMIDQIFPNLLETAIQTNIQNGTWFDIDRAIVADLIQRDMDKVNSVIDGYDTAEKVLTGTLHRFERFSFLSFFARNTARRRLNFPKYSLQTINTHPKKNCL